MMMKKSETYNVVKADYEFLDFFSDVHLLLDTEPTVSELTIKLVAHRKELVVLSFQDLLPGDCGTYNLLQELLHLHFHRIVDYLGHKIILRQCLHLDILLHKHA